MLLADTCAKESLTAACLSGDIILARSILGGTASKSKRVRPHRVAQHTAHGTRTGLTTPNTLPVRSAARFAPSCSRDVAHESRSAEAEALAWASVHGGGGAARPRGAPRRGHTRGGGGGSREQNWEGWGVAPPAARARSARSAQLGDDEGDHAARSASRGQEPTPSPLSTRVEDRDEPAAQARPGWRIETSLRRKGVRGGGSGRACGAKPSGVESRDKPAARQCARGTRGRGGCTGGRA